MPDTLADILHLMQKYSIDTIVYGKPHIARLKEQLTAITDQLMQASP
jgi:hypothetical protein